MSHRIVTDAAGSAWQIWAVRPTPRTGYGAATLAPEYADGWLAFERLGEPVEKRRYAPVPPGWADASVADVLALLATARPVTIRLPRPQA